MPTSLSGAISPIMDRIVALKPKKILDIGVGWGKYGLLCREYLQGSNCLERLDGVEAFEPYIGPIQRAIYDNLYIEDIRKHELKTDYDLYLLIDVIEHMPKSDGVALLNRLDGMVIVSTPIGYVEQGAEFGNQYEVHRSAWFPKDFSVETLSNDHHGIYFIPKEKPWK